MSERFVHIPKVIVLYPWSIPATKHFKTESELREIQEGTARELANSLHDYGNGYDMLAVFQELVRHGDERKGAEFFQIIRKERPDTLEIFDLVPQQIRSKLENTPPWQLPSCPQDFSKEIKITYIQ